jgi:sulfur carrier protein
MNDLRAMTDGHITIQFNGQSIELPTDTSIEQMLAVVQMRSQLVAVEVNLEVVPREQHATYLLHGGDVVEAVTLVGGG